MNYRQLILALILVIIYSSVNGQGITRIYPKTLQIPGDTFRVKFSNSSYVMPLTISKRDTVDMGTDGTINMYATIYHGIDSTIIHYNNFPNGEVYFIPIQSSSQTAVYRLHFNPVTASFSSSYIAQHEGKVQFEIPEIYELANIIWTLSPNGQRASNLYKKGDYYNKVISYFKPFMNHSVFKHLDFPDSTYLKMYYDFRENSLAYSFLDNDIVSHGPYFYVMGDDFLTHNSLFRQLLPMIEDFADESNYRAFYANNKSFYSQQIDREEELMPVNDMWIWLEKQFPGINYQSYKVIFSPLIGGSHSTQNFSTFSNDKWYQESVMFVCGPDGYDARASLNEQQKRGLMSGIVFTEIDHNYVNQTSFKYSATIDSIFSQRSNWTSNGGDETFYTTPMAIFNEYMTHAVFCLWVLDKYDAPTAEFVIKSRESLMVDQRRFKRFAEFNKELIELRKKNSEKTVLDLFPKILIWCKL